MKRRSLRWEKNILRSRKMWESRKEMPLRERWDFSSQEELFCSDFHFIWLKETIKEQFSILKKKKITKLLLTEEKSCDVRSSMEIYLNSAVSRTLIGKDRKILQCHWYGMEWSNVVESCQLSIEMIFNS